MGDLSHLDGQSLQRFIDTDLKEFLTQTEDIRKDKDSGDANRPVRALKSLVDNEATADTLNQNQFLALGPMVSDATTTHGKGLIDALARSAKSIDTVLADQQRLWQDIDRDFREVIKAIGDRQSDNLTEIDAQKALDLFADVDDDLGGSNTTSTSTSTGTNSDT
ncbi:type VII secretion system-associated protein [Streptomyces sp. NPDC088812]|uniref:type VII secretion system-associated protein n=1 Tax=Streptomyces sp. NPDC088812 TaxID=3365905 RepID=UPI00380FDAEA